MTDPKCRHCGAPTRQVGSYESKNENRPEDGVKCCVIYRCTKCEKLTGTTVKR